MSTTAIVNKMVSLYYFDEGEIKFTPEQQMVSEPAPLQAMYPEGQLAG